ncbi:MAG TPA: metallophosphoesterase [Kofleriaceae bacterium]
MKRLLIVGLLAACTRPADERAPLELSVGNAAIADASVEVAGGLAAVRELTDHKLELWANSPVLSINLVVGNTAGGDWTIIVRNTLVDAVLDEGTARYTRDVDQHPTVGIFHVPLAPGAHTLRVAPPDADTIEPFTVAAMADIQTALPEVDDVFERISAVPNARFVIAMGDITERSQVDEYELFEKQLVTLTIPFYTTLGNHELWADPARFFDRFGRASFQFEFKGAMFTFADSGDAGIDPLVEEWLQGWLANARDRTSIFLTHIPPIDPLGVRYGGFRSTQDGRRLLTRLAEANVDLTLYGHIHTYVKFDNAGIPAYISGGGGAEPMKWDGINRHFLVVNIDPVAGAIQSVDVVRVD